VSRKNSGTFVWQVFAENLSDIDAPSLPRSLVTLLLPKGSHPDVGLRRTVRDTADIVMDAIFRQKLAEKKMV
jgi:hypothetical protein